MLFLSRFFRLVLVCIFCAAAHLTLPLHCTAEESAQLDFDHSIAPLISKRCLSCHRGAEAEGGLDLSLKDSVFKGGDSGPGLVSKSPDQSLIWQRIAADEMPPEHPLPTEERELFRKWIAEGAEWGTDPIDPFAFTTDSSAGRDWWSLQQVERPQLNVSGPAAIDTLIQYRLDEAGLKMSPPATPRELIRRMKFDMHGLPPTPEEIDAFEAAMATNSEAAIDELTDQLLASPHYGERWARHWLDIARFGESQGFERDAIRTNSWYYRDWVIKSLNHDMPYDEFVRLQLAGDVLQPQDPESVIATGFLVAGPWDQVGQAQKSAAMKAVVRQDEMEDYIATVGQAFLGMTVNCARCHDHKFDPISQKEYYQIAAALAGVRHGSREVTSMQDQQQTKLLQKEIASLKGQVREVEDAVRSRLQLKNSEHALFSPEQAPIARWEFEQGLSDCVGNANIDESSKVAIEKGRLILNQEQGHARTKTQPYRLHEKTLEAWVKLSNLEQRGGALISIQKTDNITFDSVVFGEREPKHWMAGSDRFLRTKSFNGIADEIAHKELTHIAIVWHADGTIAGYRNGLPYGTPYKADHVITYEPNEWFFLFGLRHDPPTASRQLSGELEVAQVYDRALTAEEIKNSFEHEKHRVKHADVMAALNEKEKAQIDEWNQLVELKLQQIKENQPYSVYAVKPGNPESTHVLNRGNPAQKGEVVSAGGISSISGVKSNFQLDANADDRSRRIALANWITSSKNPLFARVLVNRLWHYHFGIGIVDSPNDFGFSGGKPSHPELLDWLAAELVESDFHLKHLHRLILKSKTYQQSSTWREDCGKIDIDNRLLWRYSPRRLDAESLRDNILTVAGQINLKVGGPSYQDFTTYVHNAQFYDMIDRDHPDVYRRTIYRTWIRSGRSHLLDIFDCPDPSTITPKRSITTTPLQALTLMNSSFNLRMADRFAERVLNEVGMGTPDQAARVYQLAYGRSIQEQERNQAISFIEKYSLSAFCRAIINSNEFIYVD